MPDDDQTVERSEGERVYEAPHRQSGYDPADEPPLQPDQPPAPRLTGEERGRDNRGRVAAITEAGEVIGSGAGAGGKGGPEDFDTDPQAGGGTYLLRHPEKPDRGGDASQHGST
jgi:hypothetical protein